VPRATISAGPAFGSVSPVAATGQNLASSTLPRREQFGAPSLVITYAGIRGSLLSTMSPVADIEPSTAGISNSVPVVAAPFGRRQSAFPAAKRAELVNTP
jgi:hypothetical protein